MNIFKFIKYDAIINKAIQGIIFSIIICLIFLGFEEFILKFKRYYLVAIIFVIAISFSSIFIINRIIFFKNITKNGSVIEGEIENVMILRNIEYPKDRALEIYEELQNKNLQILGLTYKFNVNNKIYLIKQLLANIKINEVLSILKRDKVNLLVNKKNPNHSLLNDLYL